MSLGHHITIERQLNERDYYCRSILDKVIFTVHVDPGYRDEISTEFETNPGTDEKKPCPFLRRSRETGGTVCAIYPSRPKVCRDFRCYRMVIRNREGLVCGRVIGRNTLRTGDQFLEKLWNEKLAAVPYGNEAVWTAMVSGILKKCGYYPDPVEK